MAMSVYPGSCAREDQTATPQEPTSTTPIMYAHAMRDNHVHDCIRVDCRLILLDVELKI